MNTYQGESGGPRDPKTLGGYCLSRCYCAGCPQYAAQVAAVQTQRAQEYDARIRREGEKWAREQGSAA